MKPYALAPLPVVGAIAAGYAYYLLNIRAGVFVHRLGCGCVEGFNTNSLTAIVWGLLTVLTALATIRVSKGWPAVYRLPYFAATALAVVFLSDLVIHYNYWL